MIPLWTCLPQAIVARHRGRKLPQQSSSTFPGSLGLRAQGQSKPFLLPWEAAGGTAMTACLHQETPVAFCSAQRVRTYYETHP